MQLLGRRYALFRDAQGRARALDDFCPHRFAPLSQGSVSKNGKLVCLYHGWSFDGTGAGCSPAQPNLKRCETGSYQVIERWDYLWLAANGVQKERLPALGWEGYTLAGSFNTLFQAPLHVALDNFSEDEHFPTVHSMLGWDFQGWPQVEFQSENFDDRTEVHYQGPQRRHPALPLFGVMPGDTYHNEWVTRFDPVHAIFTFRWEDPKTGARRPIGLRTAVFMVPETERTTRFHVFIFARIEEGSFLRHLMPVVQIVGLFLGRREVNADARLSALLADTPKSLKGMRLGKYDKPVIHNRKLLQRIYLREAAAD